MIRVFLVARLAAIRAGLRAILEDGEDIEVIAESAGIAEIDSIPPDTDVLVLADETLSQSDLELLYADNRADSALLLLTDDPRAAQTLIGLQMAVWGLLSLESPAEELWAAVRALDQGLLVGDPDLMDPLLAPAPSLFPIGSEPLEEQLTERENEVLQQIALGLANKQIARRLEISEHTVKFHVSSIYAKLGVTNRAEAVHQGIRRGLILL